MPGSLAHMTLAHITSWSRLGVCVNVAGHLCSHHCLVKARSMCERCQSPLLSPLPGQG